MWFSNDIGCFSANRTRLRNTNRLFHRTFFEAVVYNGDHVTSRIKGVLPCSRSGATNKYKYLSIMISVMEYNTGFLTMFDRFFFVTFLFPTAERQCPMAPRPEFCEIEEFQNFIRRTSWGTLLYCWPKPAYWCSYHGMALISWLYNRNEDCLNLFTDPNHCFFSSR